MRGAGAARPRLTSLLPSGEVRAPAPALYHSKKPTSKRPNLHADGGSHARLRSSWRRSAQHTSCKEGDEGFSLESAASGCPMHPHNQSSTALQASTRTAKTPSACFDVAIRGETDLREHQRLGIPIGQRTLRLGVALLQATAVSELDDGSQWHARRPKACRSVQQHQLHVDGTALRADLARRGTREGGSRDVEGDTAYSSAHGVCLI